MPNVNASVGGNPGTPSLVSAIPVGVLQLWKSGAVGSCGICEFCTARQYVGYHRLTGKQDIAHTRGLD